MMGESEWRDARAHWEAANAPAPEWGWGALPDDERSAWGASASRPEEE